MKKLHLIFTVLLCTLITAACSSGGGANGNASKEASKSVAGGNTAGEVVTLNFMGWEASPLETQSVKKGLDSFMKQHPNIKVQYQPVPNTQYAQKLLTMLAGNAAPDVFFLGAADYRAFQNGTYSWI